MPVLTCLPFRLGFGGGASNDTGTNPWNVLARGWMLTAAAAAARYTGSLGSGTAPASNPCSVNAPEETRMDEETRTTYLERTDESINHITGRTHVHHHHIIIIISSIGLPACPLVLYFGFRKQCSYKEGRERSLFLRDSRI